MSTIRMPMVTNLARKITYCEEFPSIELHDTSVGRSCEVYEKFNTLYLHLQKTHGHQTKQGADLPREAPTHKAT